MKKHTSGRPAGNNKNIKHDLLISAIKLFADNDFNAVSLKDIAKYCNTTSAMVHYYFGSKENLIKNIAEDFLIPVFLEIFQPAIDKENPLDMVKTIIDNIISLAEKHPYIAKTWSKNILNHDSMLSKYMLPYIPFDKINIFSNKLKQGQKDGLINKNLHPNLVYPSIVSNIFICMHAFDFLLDDKNNDNKIKHIKSFILKGIENE